jgi:concanavalin A-like lectin/glucanase superfamily protein
VPKIPRFGSTLRVSAVVWSVFTLWFLVAPSAASGTATTAADWEMNDPAGSTVMRDSSGHGLNGAISGQAASEGLTLNGSYFHWSSRCPACAPVQDGRVIQVPDNSQLEVPDASVRYTLEFRFRTTHGYGNYMQKGHAVSPGGQIKVQGPKGLVECMFKGANGNTVRTASPKSLSDGNWHTVKCVRTATQVQEWVDGTQVAVRNGSTGVINNSKQFTVGGKNNCDQVKVTCDYYSGDIDYIRISHG